MFKSEALSTDADAFHLLFSIRLRGLKLGGPGSITARMFPENDLDLGSIGGL